MENPNTWGKLEQVIDEALRKHYQMMLEKHCGLSDVRMIADAIRNHFLIKEKDKITNEYNNS